jgi:hypothetical protein
MREMCVTKHNCFYSSTRSLSLCGVSGDGRGSVDFVRVLGHGCLPEKFISPSTLFALAANCYNPLRECVCLCESQRTTFMDDLYESALFLLLTLAQENDEILSIFNELEIVEQQREYTSAMLWNFDEFVT